MSPEVSILKHLLTYNNWLSCRDKLSIEDFPKELRSIYSVVDNYHHSNSSGVPTDLNDADLSNLVFSNPVKDREYTQLLLGTINECDATDSTTIQLIQSLNKNRILKDISLLSYEVAEGRSTDITKLETLFQCYHGEQGTGAESGENEDFLTNDLESVVNKIVKSPGLRWRLDTMNKMLGSLRTGNFGIVFKRPETGGTTFLASETTFMAEQLKEDQGPIIWFNNEQQGEEVLLRWYQASLGKDMTSILSNVPAAQAEFLERTKDKMKLVDRASLHYKYMDAVCKKYKPSLIVVDQMDAIQGFDADRKDLQLGAIYRWLRELSKQYAPLIGVCQADGSAEGQMWLTMANVADAKTAKQAHADWILGIGKKNDAGYDNIRYLHLSKNKLLGDSDSDPSLRHGRREVLIEPMIARFRDI